MSTAADSREVILDAAERRFAARGFAATTIKDIAKEAQVNSALLYYYFADKEALYQAVLDRVLGTLSSQLRQGLHSGRTRTEAITGLVRAQATLMSQRATAPALLVREMLDSEGVYARGQMQRLVAGSFRELCELIRVGQQSGEFHDDLDPALAAISTIAQLVYFFVARPGLAAVAASGEGEVTLPTLEQFAEHAAAFSLAALRAPNAGGAA